MEHYDINTLKKLLREEMLSKRININVDAKHLYDTWICDKLLEIIEERNAKVVHAYLPMEKEIDIKPLLLKLLKQGVKVVTPKTLPKRILENRVLHDLNEIEKGVFGTTHPREADIYDGPFDLAIVPGLAFDKDHYRLGYGGGYYDNFLVKHPETFKIGIGYPFQRVPQVSREEHDLAMDVVITPE